MVEGHRAVLRQPLRVAITGGRGRLAPAIAQGLRARGDAVVLWSRTGGGGCRAMEDFPGCEAWEVVIHCAWSAVPLTAEADPARGGREDVPWLERLVPACPDALHVFLSTAAVYGNTGASPATEETPPQPLGAYARWKLAAEERLAGMAHGRALILRVTNLLGTVFQPSQPQGILPRLVHSALTGEAVEIWGDGSACKDYLHMDDFLNALEGLLDRGCTGLFNVAAGRSWTVQELVSVVEEVTGRPVRRRLLPAYGWDVSHSEVSPSKLAAVLGWRAEVGIEEAVRRALEVVRCAPEAAGWVP